MATKKGVCKNYFECEKADAEELFIIDENKPFVCPNCGKPLENVGDTSSAWTKYAALGGGVLIVVILMVWLFVGSEEQILPDLQPDPDPAPLPMPDPNPTPDLNPIPEPQLVKIETIELTRTSLDMTVGEYVELFATVKPEDAEYEVEWISANPDVIVVDQGVVQALAAGKGVVKVRAGGVTAICNVTVTNKPKKVQPAPSRKDVTVTGGVYKGETKGGKPEGIGTLYYKVRTRISKRDRQERYAEPGQYLSGEWHDGEIVIGKLYNKDGQVKEIINVGRAD